jgi:hypothetical protein
MNDGGMTESYTFYQETLNSFRGPANPIQNFQGSFQANMQSSQLQQMQASLGSGQRLPLNQVQLD